jgi:hypothetical protein
MTFEDSAATIRLEFGTSTNVALAGTHTFTVEASLANYPEFTALKKSTTFSVEVRACNFNVITGTTITNMPDFEIIKPQSLPSITKYAKFT